MTNTPIHVTTYDKKQSPLMTMFCTYDNIHNFSWTTSASCPWTTLCRPIYDMVIPLYVELSVFSVKHRLIPCTGLRNQSLSEVTLYFTDFMSIDHRCAHLVCWRILSPLQYIYYKRIGKYKNNFIICTMRKRSTTFSPRWTVPESCAKWLMIAGTQVKVLDSRSGLNFSIFCFLCQQ